MNIFSHLDATYCVGCSRYHTDSTPFCSSCNKRLTDIRIAQLNQKLMLETADLWPALAVIIKDR